jgi:hypothetical protein
MTGADETGNSFRTMAHGVLARLSPRLPRRFREAANEGQVGGSPVEGR